MAKHAISKRDFEAARLVSEQMQRGEIPNVDKALELVGKKTKGVPFQQALQECAPYELLAKFQRAQLDSHKRERITWPLRINDESGELRFFEHSDAISICKKLGYHHVFTGTVEDETAEGSGAVSQLYSLVLTPNHEHIDRALDKFYKLSGLYSAEKIEHTVYRPLEELSDEELDKYIMQHSEKSHVKQDDKTPNVIEAHKQRDIIDGKPVE